MQNFQILDARGCPCPQPLIKTRRLWKTLQTGEPFQVLVDNDIAHTNLMTFLNDQNANPESIRDGDVWIINAIRTGENQPVHSERVSARQDASEKIVSADKPGTGYIVVIKSDRMGEGDDDLGRMLIKGYLNTLKEIDDKPQAIILYNGGAKLAEQGSGTDTALQTLQKNNVDIMVCGACVEFFDLQEKLAAGRISNMYEIAEKVAATGHVVYP